MVGWSRRAAESRRRRIEYEAWFARQTPEEQERITSEAAERWARDKWKVYAILVAALLMIFGLPFLLAWTQR